MANPRGWERRLSPATGVPGGSDAAPGPRKRARRQIESPAEPMGPLPPSRGRRLSEADRRALRERHRARTEPPTPAPPATALPRPAPRMPPRPKQAAPVASRGLVVIGAVLIAGLAVVGLAGGRLFGPAESETPIADVPGIAAPPGVETPRAGFLGPGPSTPVVAPDTPAGRAPIVCLDPGHGGPDRGFVRQATDVAPAMEEAVLVLEHAWDLEYRLSQLGYKVVMTRKTDVAVNADGRDVNGDGKTAKDDPPGTARYATLDELQARINVCNEANADLLVSMHVNGYSNGTPRGYETWYTPHPARPFGDRNEDFAKLAYIYLKEELASIGYALSAGEERGVLPDTSADVQNEHSVFKHFIITGPAVPGQIVPSRMPGAIVEALFISNDFDAAILASPVGRATVVTAYQKAIIEYFEKYPPETTPE